MLLFPPEGAEQIEFIGRNSLADENIIFESINPENLHEQTAHRTKAGTHQNRQNYDGESNYIEENIGKVLLGEVREEEDGWISRVMVNGKAAHLGRPEGQPQQPQERDDAGATFRTWLIHYCRLHPKCNLQTLLAEL